MNRLLVLLFALSLAAAVRGGLSISDPAFLVAVRRAPAALRIAGIPDSPIDIPKATGAEGFGANVPYGLAAGGGSVLVIDAGDQWFVADYRIEEAPLEIGSLDYPSHPWEAAWPGGLTVTPIY